MPGGRRSSRSGPQQKAVHVLVVEDDQELAATMARTLRQDGMAVDLAGNGDIALAMSCATRHDVVIVAHDLQPFTGDDLCKQLHERGCRSAFLLLLSAPTSAGPNGRATEHHLNKPFDVADLVARTRMLGTQ